MQAATFTRVVPWFSMSEWKSVYELVFSNNPGEQKDGLDRLVCWKARCPALPAAIECTLGIFQVLLDDPEHLSGECVSISREQQLRLMYSTAVMRFLNLMVEGTDEDFSGTMYARAVKLSIPEWLVNLRHDAAHGTSLPDLSLLRAAAIFISKWLHEHYWEHEAEVIQDWYVSEVEISALSQDEKKLSSIMEAWEALSIYKLAGFENMRQIPDHNLKSSIVSIHKMLQENDNPYGMKYNSPAKVPNVLALVLKRLTRFFKTKTTTLDKASLLADILVGGDFLLPSESLMKIIYPNGFELSDTLQHLPIALVDCCEDMIGTLWDLGAIPALVTKLVSFISDETESSLKKNIAALWVQKLLLSCLKVREARKVRFAIRERLDCKSLYDEYKIPLEANRNAVITSLAFAAVENQRSDLKLGYIWKVSPIPTVLTDVFLLKQSISAPSKFSSIFLPCLMELVVPAIPLETRALLLDLLELYCNDDCDVEVTDQRIFSVSDLPCNNRLENVTLSEKDQSPSWCENSSLELQSYWSISQGHLEWQKCPLGTLPWFREQYHLDQEEYEGKHQHRTWPKLFIQSEWSPVTNTIEDVTESRHLVESQLHKVKTGRVVKPLANKSTPIRMQKIFKQSTKQKALNFLTGD